MTVDRISDDGSGGKYRIGQCYSCGFLFVNPRPTEHELKELYAQHAIYFREEYEHVSLELPTLRGVLREIRRFIAAGSLLEVGCGRGELLELARRSGFRVFGCDLQRSATLDPAIGMHVGTLSTMRAPEGPFDCVAMRNTLEHLFDPSEELRICYHLLREGGILYLKVPNAAYEHGWRCRLLMGKSNVFGPPWHLNYFTPTTLTRLLRRDGFEVATWLLERPTIDRQRLRDLAQQSAFVLLEGIRALTLGKRFPKPLVMTCIARKVPIANRNSSFPGDDAPCDSPRRL